MNIAAILALSDFPMWEQTVRHLCELCDGLYVRFDGVNGDPEIARALPSVAGKKLKRVEVVQEAWQPPMWREDCIRMLDEVGPDVVVFLDQDEMFDGAIRDEIEAFYQSDKDAMMLSYAPMEMADGTVLNEGMPYPPEPHQKVFRWKAGLSYFPWHRYGATVAKYVHPSHHWSAKAKIRHFCCHTKGLQQVKEWRSDTPIQKASKPVTLLGFGQSSRKECPILGEVWSLNNCYEQFAPETMKFITRIFDMHQFGKRGRQQIWNEAAAEFSEVELPDRNFLRMKDGRTHVWHLSQLAQIGHRIILLEAHQQVPCSEALPIHDIEASLGATIWGGTVAYMIAQAIFEEYTEIRVYGFDQDDWEHTTQRESAAWWLGYAAGRGITISGHLGITRRHRLRYGYDYGPEWDHERNKELWAPFPMEVLIKDAPRSVMGLPFDGIR